MLLATLMLTAACSKENPKPNGQEQTTPEEDDEEEGNGRYLVLYCSRTGNTERMAQTIQSTLDCDMIVVEPEVSYEEDYNAMLDRAQEELDAIGQGNYPAITTSVEVSMSTISCSSAIPFGMAILPPRCRLSCTTTPIC